MRARNKWFLFGAIGLFVLVGVVFSLRSTQPSYQGKPLSDWLKNLDPDNGEAQKKAAKHAIHEMGAAAVPYLVRDLRSHDSAERRKRAHLAFPEIASVATTAVPELAEALADADADVRMRAANCLEWVAWEANADQAVLALIRVLKDPDMRVRQNAAAALKNMRTPAVSQAVPALLERLSSDERFEVRGTAAEALGSIRPTNAETIQALIRALRDDAEGVRSCAARALGNLGADAKEAVPELLRLAQEDNPYIRDRAREELKKIAPDTPAPTAVK